MVPNSPDEDVEKQERCFGDLCVAENSNLLDSEESRNYFN